MVRGWEADIFGEKDPLRALDCRGYLSLWLGLIGRVSVHRGQGKSSFQCVLCQQSGSTGREVIIACHDLYLLIFQQASDHRGGLSQESRLDLGICLRGRLEIGAGLVYRRLNMGKESADLSGYFFALNRGLHSAAVGVPQHEDYLCA